MAYSMDFTQRDAFICTECGEGFRQYAKLIKHMAVHGPTSTFYSDSVSISNGSSINASIEVALHENGMLTLVDRSVLSNFTFLFGKPPPKQVMLPTSKQENPPTAKLPVNQPILIGCERCGQTFKTHKSLQRHHQYRALDQGFRCTLCCKVLNDQESLQSHLQQHAHERFYSCGHCGKRYLRQVALVSHQKQCPGFVESWIMSRPNDYKPNSIERSYPCKICGLRFFWLSDLQTHLSSHSNMPRQSQGTPSVEKKIGDGVTLVGEPCRCGVCGEHFNKVSELGEHHKNKHPDDIGVKDSSGPPVKMKEQHLGVTLNSTSEPQHKQFLRATKRGGPRARTARFDGVMFSCRLCHCSFVHSSSLSRHMRYHKGTLPTCNFCGRRFQQRCDVTKHIATHHSSALQAKASTQAEIREEEASQNPGLRKGELRSAFRFKRISKPKMYKCRECFRVFGLLGVFQRHMQIHKRGPAKVLFYCPHCPSSFSFQSALSRHLEIKHSIDSNPPQAETLDQQEKSVNANTTSEVKSSVTPNETSERDLEA